MARTQLRTKRASERQSAADAGPAVVPAAEPTAVPVAGEPAEPAAKPEAKKLPLMWDYLEDPARNLDGTTTMVYRLEPAINRPSRSHCIGQHAGMLTRDQVLREYGSGVYDFYVKDR